jgi:hypothetical protein
MEELLLCVWLEMVDTVMPGPTQHNHKFGRQWSHKLGVSLNIKHSWLNYFNALGRERLELKLVSNLMDKSFYSVLG